MINATLLIQMLNFYGAYLIFTHILLKPALALIMHQQERERQLNHAIVDLQNQIVAHKEEQTRAWRACMQALSLLKPNIGARGVQKKISTPVVPEMRVDETEKKALVDMLARTVAEHITDNGVRVPRD